jgi:hypothetical protein
MLTRLEIDNFRCFEGFVWEQIRKKQLILGANGCGKSSMIDALMNLRRFVAGDRVEELFPLAERTKWMKQPNQTFSLHAEINCVPYCYTLIVGALGSPARPMVQSEKLDCGNGRLLVDFELGKVTIHPPGISYELKGNRSVISSLNDNDHTGLAVRFAEWMETVRVFQLNPFTMDSRSEKEDWDPKVDLSNFANWYRWLNRRPDLEGQKAQLSKSLRETFEGFDSLDLKDVGKDVKLLDARFRREDGNLMEYGFEELSEGQRCLTCLYTILHLLVAEGGTVIIDEPENFVSLREMQPWLMTADDVVDDAPGQLILMSHHPELIDQWAPPYGVRFLRDGAGPIHVKAWTGVPDSSLSAAELVARGWEDD